MEIKKVGVVGGGLMGHGIAQVAAQAGYDVVLREVDQDDARQGRSARSRSSSAARSRRASSSSRRPTRSAAGSHADDRLRGLRRLRPGDRGDHREPRRASSRCGASSTGSCKEDAVFATNTSSLSVIDQAASTERPEPLHRPALLQPGAGDAAARGRPHGDDRRGRIRDRLRVRREAAARRSSRARTRPASSSTACWCPTCSTRSAPTRRASGSIEEIDAAMKAGADHPMGPFTLLDFVGPRHDRQSIARHHVRRVPRDAASRRRRRCARWSRPATTGEKSGRGFYDYSGDKPVAGRPRRLALFSEVLTVETEGDVVRRFGARHFLEGLCVQDQQERVLGLRVEHH